MVTCILLVLLAVLMFLGALGVKGVTLAQKCGGLLSVAWQSVGLIVDDVIRAVLIKQHAVDDALHEHGFALESFALFGRLGDV